MRIKRPNFQCIEIQMGSMIDMVFLLLVFFMVTAKPIKPESDIGLNLPGTVTQDTPLNLPDEQIIQIHANGQIALNDAPVDQPENTRLPELRKILTRLKESTQANKTEPLITIAPHDETPHQRIVDVMNICALVGIHNITFDTSATKLSHE